MREKRWELRQKERDRLKVVQELRQRQIRQRQAAERMGRSRRHKRRLLRRVRQEGEQGVLQRLRGRPSNRKIPAARQEQIPAPVRSRYADCGTTLGSEHLARQKLRVSRETLRNWMIAAGWGKARR